MFGGKTDGDQTSDRRLAKAEEDPYLIGSHMNVRPTWLLPTCYLRSHEILLNFNDLATLD